MRPWFAAVALISLGVMAWNLHRIDTRLQETSRAEAFACGAWWAVGQFGRQIPNYTWSLSEDCEVERNNAVAHGLSAALISQRRSP